MANRKISKVLFNPAVGELTPILRDCFAFLANHTELDGIFRISGSLPKIEAIMTAYEKNKPGASTLLQQSADPHTVSGVLKMILRCIDRPMLTSELHDAWVASVSIPSAQHRLDVHTLLASVLPPGNQVCMHHFFDLVSKVAAKGAVNRMTPQNLAIVFSPTLLRPESQSIQSLVESVNSLNLLIVQLIDKSASIFVGPGAFSHTPHDVELLIAPLSPGVQECIRKGITALQNGRSGGAASSSTSSSPASSSSEPRSMPHLSMGMGMASNILSNVKGKITSHRAPKASPSTDAVALEDPSSDLEPAPPPVVVTPEDRAAIRIQTAWRGHHVRARCGASLRDKALMSRQVPFNLAYGKFFSIFSDVVLNMGDQFELYQTPLSEVPISAAESAQHFSNLTLDIVFTNLAALHSVFKEILVQVESQWIGNPTWPFVSTNVGEQLLAKMYLFPCIEMYLKQYSTTIKLIAYCLQLDPERRQLMQLLPSQSKVFFC
ncbi:MAG: hypothetical protein Q8P67_14285 [archaeon]|nr:hypothetical protein [archaeon]